MLVQHPADLDTACVLASLQEEVGDSYKRRDNMRLESGFHPRTLTKSLLPLPAPPPHVKQVAPQPSDDRRSAESARASSPLEAKAAALCTYRHAMGLCYKCNEKWTKDHMCSSTVQLHADQEIWELFQVEDDENTSPNSINTNGPNEQLLMESSKTALTGSQAPRTVKFKGYIQDKVVSVLVDSGSSSSFISTSIATHLSNVTPLVSPSSVQVAGGGILHCEAVIHNVVWVISGYSFQLELRVLPLTAYDLIIGMDCSRSTAL